MKVIEWSNPHKNNYRRTWGIMVAENRDEQWLLTQARKANWPELVIWTNDHSEQAEKFLQIPLWGQYSQMFFYTDFMNPESHQVGSYYIPIDEDVHIDLYVTKTSDGHEVIAWCNNKSYMSGTTTRNNIFVDPDIFSKIVQYFIGLIEVEIKPYQPN